MRCERRRFVYYGRNRERFILSSEPREGAGAGQQPPREKRLKGVFCGPLTHRGQVGGGARPFDEADVVNSAALQHGL